MSPSRALLERFTSPDRTFSPTPLWWWSGDEVTRDRIGWQLEQFSSGGINNLVIINLAPRGPLYAAPADQPAWFSESWWELFGYTCEVAERLGMKIWFYDQLGFSGANIPGSLTRNNPWAAGQRLVATPLDRLALDTLSAERFLAAYDDRGNSYAYQDLAALQTKINSGMIMVVSINRTSFDYLNPDATELLFDYVHREFERRLPDYLGTVIPGSFQDELPPTNSWTPGLPDAFRERHGYDLLDELPALFGGHDDLAAKIRTDYFAVRTQMAEDAFFRPLGEWHEEHNMLLGADQSHPARSGWPTQSTQLYSDYFRTHRWYSAAGSDHNGDAKVHSSMAHLYGHQRVWMESFHSSGWGGTLEETYDWLIPFVRSGADLYNPHATYFGTYGGWFEWAPPSTDWRQPYWKHYPQFSEAVARLCSVANWGSYQASVALLHPSTVTQALTTLATPTSTGGDGVLGHPYEEVDQAQRLYIELCGEGNWFEPQLGALDAAGIAFDVIDDASIQSAAGDGNALAVRQQRYRTVVLPGAVALEPGTVEALIDLLDRGGSVIAVGARPRLVSGRNSDDSLITTLNAHPGFVSVAGSDAAVELLRERDTEPRSDVPLLVRRGTGADHDQFVALVTATWPSATQSLEAKGLWTRKHFDRRRYATRRRVTIEGSVTDAEVWDPATGTRRPVQAESVGGASSITVDLAGAPAVFLTWRTTGTGMAAAVAETAPQAVPRKLAELADWVGELVPTLDNRWGDLARPAGAELDRLQLWSFDWATTPGQDVEPTEWVPARATFGQLARSYGPVPSADAPPPLDQDQIADVVRGATPLADRSWEVCEYSASRGREREIGQLGNKSLVYEEFVQVAAPDESAVAVVRAVVGGIDAGPADLVIGAGAAKRVWWNGVEVTPATQDYYLITGVEVHGGGNVLEYQLGTSENNGRRGRPGTLGSFFALSRPGSFAPSPHVITAAPVHGPTRLVYRKDFEVAPGITSGRLIVGSHATATVRIDEQLVAVQARTELYEDRAGVSPMFFEHDVSGSLRPGRHVLQIEIEAFPGAEYAYADLALRSDDGVQTVGTDQSWTVEGPQGSGPVSVLTGRWSELAFARAARRPHPLPGAHWMRGPAEIGEQVLPISVGESAAPSVQWYRITLPAGATAVRWTTVGDAQVEVVDAGGAAYRQQDRQLIFDPPLPAVTEMIIRIPARPFARAGAAWAGPLEVDCVPAPIRLGRWRDRGLSSWSGGLAYRCTVDPDDLDTPDAELILDLGDLRGTAEVLMDGESVGTAFCAPFRFDLGRRVGPFELTVLVFNTLGPFLYESTPTEWVLEGQLDSGLYGPVTLLASINGPG
jgi:hypothetical protein